MIVTVVDQSMFYIIIVSCIVFGASYGYKIEGRVSVPGEKSLATTTVLVDDGHFKGFIR